jgi:hypothetical protein
MSCALLIITSTAAKVLAAAVQVMGVLAFLVDWGIQLLNNAKFGAVRERIGSQGEGLGVLRALRAGGGCGVRVEGRQSHVAPCALTLALAYQGTHHAPAGGFFGPFFLYVAISGAYALVAGGLVSFLEPLAAGSGIPEIKTYLNGRLGVCTRVRVCVAGGVGVTGLG